MPGTVRLDHAVTRSMDSFLHEWTRVLPRALAAYIPGGMVVLLAYQLGGFIVGVAVDLVVLILGVIVLQAADVTRVAMSHSRTPAPFWRAVWGLRTRTATLAGAIGLILLATILPSLAFSTLATVALITGVHCAYDSTGALSCSTNVVGYVLIMGLYLVAFLPITVRWSVLVPVVALERHGVIASLRRCLQVTAGETFRLSVWFVISVAVSSGLLLGAQVAFAHVIPEEHVAIFFASAIGDTLGGSFLVILLTEVYFHLLATQSVRAVPPPAFATTGPTVRTRTIRRRMLVGAWAAAWLCVAIAVTAVMARGHNTGPVIDVGNVDARRALLTTSQMRGYVVVSSYGTAENASVTFQGAATSPFLSVSAIATNAGNAAHAAAFEPQMLQVLVTPDSRPVAGLQSSGSNFVAYSSPTSGVIVWTQGQLLCVLVVAPHYGQSPDMHLADSLAQMQEANALAAER